MSEFEMLRYEASSRRPRAMYVSTSARVLLALLRCQSSVGLALAGERYRGHGLWRVALALGELPCADDDGGGVVDGLHHGSSPQPGELPKAYQR